VRIGPLFRVSIFVAASSCASQSPPPVVAATPAPSATAPVGDPDGDDPTKPVEHPFAKDNAAAMVLMDAAVDKRFHAMGACIDAFRARKHSSFAKFVVKIGVDENGTLIAVTGNDGDTDREANVCLQKALKRAPFPTSHAGIIEIVKTFSYEAVYR
jgi:hypothetical protein